MPDHDRLPIGADIVEAAMQSWPNYPADGFPSDDALRLALEAAVRAALDKLGLHVEYDYPNVGTPEQRYTPDRQRLTTNWGPVDAEPAPDPLRCICGHTVGWHDRPGRACARRDCACACFASSAKDASVRVDSEPSA